MASTLVRTLCFIANAAALLAFEGLKETFRASALFGEKSDRVDIFLSTTVSTHSRRATPQTNDPLRCSLRECNEYRLARSLLTSVYHWSFTAVCLLMQKNESTLNIDDDVIDERKGKAVV